MKTDKILELIDNSDLNRLQKNASKAFIMRAEEDNKIIEEDRLLIEQVANEKRLSQIILSTDEVKIYTVYGKNEWDIKYPFRSIYLDKDKVWRRTSTVSSTLDIAFLAYLERKYLSENSRFTDFALKMLEIDVE